MARGAFPSRGMRQRKHWHGTTNNALAFVGSSTGVLASFSLNDPATVLRILGEVVVFPGVAVGGYSDADEARMSVGIGIVSSDAAAVGSSAMPDPGGEPEFDWLWWWSTVWAIPDVDSTVVGLNQIRIPVHSKAMRKMKPASTIVVVAEYEDLQGAPPLDVRGGFRILFGE